MKYERYINKLNVDLKGKIYIVTGANAGLGFETSRYLMYLGAEVIMACRNESKAKKALEEIRSEIPYAKGKILLYDQASLLSIKNFADEIKKLPHLDGLVCNAGIYYPKKGSKTVDGFELTVGTNYLGQFYLVDCLYDYLVKCQTRLIIVSSLVAFNAHIKDINSFDYKSRNKLYGVSKLLLSREAYELNEKGELEIFLTHPGVCSTNILFNKDTGLKSSFARTGRRVLNIFTHSSAKAALSILLGCIVPYQKNIYIKPRGLFAISGYPKITKMPKKFGSSGLIDATKNILRKKENYVNS